METLGVTSPAPISPSRRAAKRLAIAVDDALPRPDGAVVLAYHRVGATTASPVDISTEMFRRQMSHVRASAQPVSLDTVVSDAGSGELGAEAVAITFDDGTADFVDHALPVLVDLQLPVTLYLSTGFVDSRLEYPNAGVPISWNGLRECVSTGLVTIGAHTHNHVLLDRCTTAVARRELDVCNDRIRNELDVDPEHFAYPKAVAASKEVAELVRSRYRSAAIAGTRPNAPDTFDPYALFRSPIQHADGWDGFVRKVRGGMRAEDDLRRMINVARYWGKNT